MLAWSQFCKARLVDVAEMIEEINFCASFSALLCNFFTKKRVRHFRDRPSKGNEIDRWFNAFDEIR